MGDAPNFTRLRQRLAGKWQIPTLLCSLALLATALYTLRPPPAALDLPAANQYLATLVSGGMYDHALEIGDALLVREGDSEQDRAPIRLQVARARFGEAERLGFRTTAVGHHIVRDYQQATEHGISLDPLDFERMGHAFEWDERFDQAVDSYERAVKAGVETALALRRRIIELLRDHELADAATLSARIEALLKDVPAHRQDLTIWAIEEQLYSLEAQGRLAEGTTLLARYAEAFRGGDFEDRFAFLEALLLYKSGYYDDAEIRARAILNHAQPQDDAYAMAAWLLGCVVMFDDGPKRPEEAVTFFDQVTGIAPNTPYGVASFIGNAEALGLLERHDDALDSYRVALQLLPNLRDKRLVNRDVLRASLGVSAERARRAGDTRNALAYSERAAALIDGTEVEQATMFLQQLAADQLQLADELSRRSGELSADSPAEPAADDLNDEARRLRIAAADTLTKIAQLNVLNERRGADAAWQAAEAAALAGEADRAARMFQAYVQERPGDPLVPRALLRMGQLHKSVGELDDAITAFQECYRRFPRTLDGARALIPLAESYLAKTPADAEMAEKTLAIIVSESDVFTPAAPEFSDALLLMGEAQSLQGDHEHAIATFEEVVARYPDDPRAWRARYLLADAYRQSALAVKAAAASARSVAESDQLRSAYTGRFGAARSRFRELIDEFSARNAASFSALEQLYLRHSVLYEADCYFETQDYRHALKLYEEAAGIYQDHPSALAAYVQIINCHVFLGEPRDARAALSRALVVVDSMPERAFATSVSPETRADWKRYIEWLGASELF